MYKPKDFAKLLGVSVRTLQRWDTEGTFKAFRSPTNRRYYTYQQYLDYIGGEQNANVIEKSTVIYSRVSSRKQKDDLQNQTEFLRQFCNAKGWIVSEAIEEIGSGLNYNRVKWNKLLDEVFDHKIDRIVISAKDRFVRFGFDWLSDLCKKFGAEIVVVNNESLSPTQEMVEDILAIVHVFSGKLDGLRKYKKMMQEDKELDKNIQDGSHPE